MTDPASIRIRPDGPYLVTGMAVRQLPTWPDADVDGSFPPIAGPDLPIPGKPGKTAAALLCRCGLSSQKPFCDGTHRGRFDGTETAALPDDAASPTAAADPTDAAALDGPSAVVGVIDHGPLWLAEPVQLELSDGRSIRTQPGTSLCRCGLSATKPYCDGAHDGIARLDSAPPEESGTTIGD